MFKFTLFQEDKKATEAKTLETVKRILLETAGPLPLSDADLAPSASTGK